MKPHTGRCKSIRKARARQRGTQTARELSYASQAPYNNGPPDGFCPECGSQEWCAVFRRCAQAEPLNEF